MTSVEALTSVLALSGLDAVLSIDRATLDALPVGLCVFAADGRVVRFNQRAADLWSEVADGGFSAELAPFFRAGEFPFSKEILVQRPGALPTLLLVNVEPIRSGANIEGAIGCIRDITGERKAEDFLRESEAHFRELLRVLPAAIYTTDRDGFITFVNQAAVDIAGREPEIGKDRWCVSWRLFLPDGTPLAHEDCPMAVALQERRPVRDVEIIVERPDGQLIPVMPFPTPLHDRGGNFVGAVNVLVDVGRLKRSERSLARRADEQTALYHFTDRLYRCTTLDAAAEAALDAIVDALRCDRAAILMADADGVARFRAWRGLSESYRNAVNGHTPWKSGERDPQPVFVADIAATAEPEAIKAAVRSEGIASLAFIPLMANGALVGKFMAYHDEPHPFTLQERGLAVTIARHLGFSIERQQAEQARLAAEEALRSREERLRAVFDCAAVGVAVLSPEGRFLEANDTYRAITGYSPQELTAFDCVGLTYVEDRPRMQAMLAELLAGRRPNFVIEKRTFRKDGRLIWVQKSISVTRDAAGNPVQLVSLCQDISERKAAEAQRDLMVAELSHRVKNTLATVVSIAQQTFSSAGTLEEARRSFDGRIRALAQTHGRLAEANWSGVFFDAVLQDELAPYLNDSGQNARLVGPPIVLSPKFAVVLGMALHELATNAAKYGALSVKGGAVDVNWDCPPGMGELRIHWSESGGPSVSPPSRSGFGRLLLERALASDLNGRVELDFAESGLQCRIAVPLNDQAARLN